MTEISIRTEPVSLGLQADMHSIYICSPRAHLPYIAISRYIRTACDSNVVFTPGDGTACAVRGQRLILCNVANSLTLICLQFPCPASERKDLTSHFTHGFHLQLVLVLLQLSTVMEQQLANLLLSTLSPDRNIRVHAELQLVDIQRFGGTLDTSDS